MKNHFSINFLLVQILLTGCVSPEKNSLILQDDTITRSQVHMGTFFSIQLPKRNSKKIDPAFQIIKNLDLLLSDYSSDSEISLLNKERSLTVSSETIEIIRNSLEIEKATKGAFSPKFGFLTRSLYKFNSENQQVPDKDAVRQAAKYAHNGSLTIEGRKISLKGSKFNLDLGGIGKGFAVDKVIEYFITNGLFKAQVSASGDIGCLGSCDIKLENPFKKGQTLGRFQFKGERLAISTSGNYRQFVKNKKFNHLLDSNGQPQRIFASVTTAMHSISNPKVILYNAFADALATAATTLSQSKATQLLERMNIEYLLITNQGKVLLSQNFCSVLDCSDLDRQKWFKTKSINIPENERI